MLTFGFILIMRTMLQFCGLNSVPLGTWSSRRQLVKGLQTCLFLRVLVASCLYIHVATHLYSVLHLYMLDNKILLKLEKIVNSIEINPNSTYPLSEPSVHYWLNHLLQ